MRKQYNTVSFKGQVVFVGIDVHKRQWTVTIQHCGHAQKSFTMDPDPEKLAEHLKRNYPDAEYRSHLVKRSLMEHTPSTILTAMTF